MNAPRQNAQIVFSSSYRDLLDTLALQAVPQDAYCSISEVLLHQPQIREPVLVLRENCTTVYAALGNVAGYIRQDTSVAPWHGQGLYRKNRSVQAVPFFP